MYSDFPYNGCAEVRIMMSKANSAVHKMQNFIHTHLQGPITARDVAGAADTPSITLRGCSRK